jgi:hypothetical protein
MKFFIRTGLAAGAVMLVLALVSVSWIRYSAHSTCASVGSPAPPQIAHDEGSTALVDEIVPEYQIGEKHSVFIEAPPARVFGSLKRAKFDEQSVIKLFDLLPVIAGKRDASSLWQDEKPLYGTLRETSGLVLERPNKELVTVSIATVDEHIPSTPNTARGFGAYRLRHNEMKLPVSFRVDSETGGSRLTTETRIMFADRNLCHDYYWYWGVIYPGSSLLRIDFLQAVKHRAEAALSPDAQGKYLDTALDGGMA